MKKIQDPDQDKDTRYYIELQLTTLKVIGHGYDQKQNLNKGRQSDETRHRIFLTKGQYNKFIERYKANKT